MAWQDDAVRLHGEGKMHTEIARILSTQYNPIPISPEQVRSMLRRRSEKADLTEESAVLHLTDLHCGRRTKSFGVGTFKTRLHSVVDHALQIHDILRHGYKFRELVVADTGDNLDGDEIYKTHAYHTDPEAAYSLEQVVVLLDAMKAEIPRLKAVAPKIRFIGVPGNHGRVSRFTHEANNWDLLFYHMLQREFEDDPVISVEYAKDFSNTVEVEGHGILLYHGAGIRMYQNMPFYGIRQRVMRWTGSMPKPFEVVLMGHFHQVLQDSFNGIRVLLSGTMVSDDEWAVENLGMDGERRFQFFGVHKDRPVTWRYELETE
jgi:predicted phosphodiesterase